MLSFYKFYRFFRQSRFAHAVASLPPDSKFIQAFQQYAYYRLGMYRTASVRRPVKNSWRSLFATAVSLAASGDRENAEVFLSHESVLRVLQPHRLELAKALLAFHPDFAARLLPSNAPTALKVAVWLMEGRVFLAQSSLVQESLAFEKNPDLFLLKINASGLNPLDQTYMLNAYLRAHDLAPIALRNMGFPPGATNLKSAVALPVERGPLVSVLMTAFDSESRIELAIESLLAQSYQDLEIIVVDDASKDAVGDVVNAIAARDPRVRYLRLPVNVGTYAAKTMGLQLAKGDFVTCHDSDDWAHPQKIAMQVAPLLTDGRIVFTTSHMVRIQDNGVFYARQIYPLTRLNSSSVLFRKKIVLDRCGAWDFVRTGADSEFLARLKLAFGSKAMSRITKPLSFCAHRPNSLMTQATTGYDRNGVSATRLDYWEAFANWHIEELRQGRVPKLPNQIASRPFDVPGAIRVPPEDVEHCMLTLGLDTF